MTSSPDDPALYLYAQGHVALDLHKTGNGDVAATSLSHRYLYAPGVDSLLAFESFGGRDNPGNSGTGSYALYWTALDHQNSVRDVLTSSGTVHEHRDYDSFGQITAYDSAGAAKDLSVDALDTVFGFAGREWDNDAGLYYNRARWFSPALGRFLSEDPLGFNAGDSNLYRYAGNNPVNRTDPSGLYFSDYGYYDSFSWDIGFESFDWNFGFNDYSGSAFSSFDSYNHGYDIGFSAPSEYGLPSFEVPGISDDGRYSGLPFGVTERQVFLGSSDWNLGRLPAIDRLDIAPGISYYGPESLSYKIPGALDLAQRYTHAVMKLRQLQDSHAAADRANFILGEYAIGSSDTYGQGLIDKRNAWIKQIEQLYAAGGYDELVFAYRPYEPWLSDEQVVLGNEATLFRGVNNLAAYSYSAAANDLLRPSPGAVPVSSPFEFAFASGVYAAATQGVGAAVAASADEFIGVPAVSLGARLISGSRFAAEHVIEGQINKHGQAVGFHHRPGGVNPSNARVIRIIKSPNSFGVYRAEVAVYNSTTNSWVLKNRPSTFFPDSWSRTRVVLETYGAFFNRSHPDPAKPRFWTGLSPSGLQISGYEDDAGNIATAFAEYLRP